jgi:hypothetical protein
MRTLTVNQRHISSWADYIEPTTFGFWELGELGCIESWAVTGLTEHI